MQSLLTSYTSYFNLRHDRHGHLFDGRFKGKLVQGDEYLLALSRYVHLNPVRVSGLESSEARRKVLSSYYWSSYLQYIGRRKKLPFVVFAPTLALLPGRGPAGRYREYVEQGLDPDMEDWGLGEDSPLSIGDSGFRDCVQDKYAALVSAVKRPEDIAFRPTEQAWKPDVVLAVLSEIMKCDPSAFRLRLHGQHYRPFAAHFLTRFAGLSRREVAAFLGGTTGPAVTQQLSRYRQAVGQSRRLRKLSSLCETALREREGESHLA